jgi:hypothetical protein
MDFHGLNIFVSKYDNHKFTVNVSSFPESIIHKPINKQYSKCNSMLGE